MSKQTAAQNNNNKQQQQQINSLKNELNQIKKKEKKPKRKQRNINVNRQIQKSVFGAYMGNSAKRYLHALVDPFDAPPCIVPSFPALLVRPIKVWSKGTFSTVSGGAPAADGFGFIVACPSYGPAGDYNIVYANNNTLTTSTIDLQTAGVGTGSLSNSEYKFADFGEQKAQYRVVSCGLRIRNITPALTRGGQTIGLTEPSHSSMDGFDVNRMDSYSESARHSAKDLGSWIQLVWRPVDTDDADFQFTFPTAYQLNGYDMGFVVIAPSGNPQTYEFECYGLYEIQGSNVTSKVASVADTKGFEAINNVMVSARTLHRPHVRDDRLVPAAMAHADDTLVNQMTHVGRSSKKVEMSDDLKGAVGGLGAVGAIGVTAGILGLLGL